MKSKRLYSIDALRGFIILLMLFVNDIAGVKNTPGWLRHAGFNADNMTLPDLVFPAFLFIMGMSIPLAFAKRMNSNDNINLLKHVLYRVFSLIVIGLFMVNSHYCSLGTVHLNLLWKTGVFIAFFLIWPVKSYQIGKFPLKYVGMLILIVCAITFSDGETQTLIALKPRWWGILGLLGWAYLWASLIHIVSKGKKIVLLASIFTIYLFFFACEYGMLKNFILSRWINIGAFWGSHSALTLSGILFTIMMKENESHLKKNSLLSYGFIFFSGITGLLIHHMRGLHSMFTCNKIMATPVWCLYSTAMTVALWLFFHWLIDRKEIKISFLVQAGQNALFVYIFYYAVMIMVEWIALFLAKDYYHSLGNMFWPGLVRSLIFAFGATYIASRAKKRDLGLKL